MRTRSAPTSAVRPRTAPNERLRGLGDPTGTTWACSRSESPSSRDASLRQSFRGRLELPLVACAEESGEPEEDAADVDADECVEGTGDVEGIEPEPEVEGGTCSPAVECFLGENATGIRMACAPDTDSGSESDESVASATSTSWMECTVERGSSCERCRE